MAGATSRSDFEANQLNPMPVDGDSDADDCPIHHGPYDASDPPVRITTCNHTFGRHCLLAWLQTSNTCPLCRAVLFPLPGSSIAERDLHIVINMALPNPSPLSTRITIFEAASEIEELSEEEIHQVHLRLDRAWQLWSNNRPDHHNSLEGALEMTIYPSGMLLFNNVNVVEQLLLRPGHLWDWSVIRHVLHCAFDDWLACYMGIGLVQLPDGFWRVARRNDMEIERVERGFAVGEELQVEMVDSLPEMHEDVENLDAFQDPANGEEWQAVMDSGFSGFTGDANVQEKL